MELQDKRKEIFGKLIGDAFWEMSKWPRNMRRKIWKKPLGDKDTFEVAFFLIGNGWYHQSCYGLKMRKNGESEHDNWTLLLTISTSKRIHGFILTFFIVVCIILMGTERDNCDDIICYAAQDVWTRDLLPTDYVGYSQIWICPDNQ